MKQKLIFVLSLVAMAWSSAVYAAERVAPTLPTAQTPESGKSYWIYNVGTGLFLGQSSRSDYYAGLSLDGYEMFVALTDKGYTIRRTSATGDYLYDNGSSEVSYYSSTHGYREQWRFIVTDGGYKIQRYGENSYYNADEYLGYTENGDKYIYSSVTEENTLWKFLDPTQAAHYAAEVKLYQALESTTGTALEGLDWFLGQYETLYSNRATATIIDLTAAAVTINNGVAIYNGYEFPEWNEYPILFSASEGNVGQNYYDTWALPYDSYTRGNYFYRAIRGEGSARLTAKLSTDKPSAFIYELGGNEENTIYKIYVDGVETRTVITDQLNGDRRFFEMLNAGTHTITWEFTSYINNDNYHWAQVENIGCVSTPLISVSLLEPGSLGTEVLYNTDHVKNVHNLKVKGKMNDDDWAKIKMMTCLIELDLSEAEVSNVPNEQFRDQKFLRKVILPEGVESIGEFAFSGSNLEETIFPSTLKTIGYRSYGSTHLVEAILPDGLESLGEYAFCDNYRLTKVDLGKTLTVVPWSGFSDCYMLKDLVIPNTLTTIEDNAFSSNKRLVISTVPSSVTSIGQCAFLNCKAIVSMTIPSSVTSIGSSAFSGCSSLKNVEIPITIWSLKSWVFDYCDALETVKMNSATVVGYEGTPISNIENVTLQVPSFLVNAYKLDSYWYNAKGFEGYDPSDNDYYEIHKSLTMNGRERFGTNPSVKVYSNVYLKMNGSETQNFKDFAIDYNSQMWCTGDNIKATGDLSVFYETSGNRWHFISLPFDVKVSEIEAFDKQYAIRYYDGANRATVGAVGSWKNYEENDVIPAGTGFIYQTNKDGWTAFHAYADGENKQQMFSTKEFSKDLALNTSESSANRGWNLVGNPYQTYYNNHMLNFTAPITVWDVWNRTYTAYSLTDDDYAIRPNEAFFVQCPGDEMQKITFPTTGKQLTDVIESQNAAKSRDGQEIAARQLIDLEMRNGEFTDKTRVVMNEAANFDYDMNFDASKFMSADSEAPQIYTIGEDGTSYAINERPQGEGEVQLGFYTQKSGAFTISMSRCDAKKVYLIDSFEGLTIDLSAQDYGFSASEGKQEARFRLVIETEEATGIESVEEKEELATGAEADAVYNLSGQRVGKDYKGIVIKNGKKYLSK